MRAYLLPGPDQPPVLGHVAEPSPAAGEVLVRVSTSSINPHDAHVASGAAAAYMTYRYPAVLGTDLCGTVEAAGTGVLDLAVGTRVFGLAREPVAHRGSFAELVAVPRDWVTPVPDGLDDSAAGALGLAALTARRCADAIRPAAGDVVLVNGATGGVGSYLIQILAGLGTHVVATARGEAASKHVRDLGADETVDWTVGDLATAVRRLHPGGITAVVDLVNRDTDTLTTLTTALVVDGGRVASTGFAGDPDALPGIGVTNVLTEADQVTLADIADLVHRGQLRSPVTQTFGLDRIEDAFTALTAGAIGKISLQI